MDGQEHRQAAARVRAQRLSHLASLTKIEAVERLVGEKNRLRRQQADAKQRALALALRERPDRRVQKRFERELRRDIRWCQTRVRHVSDTKEAGGGVGR